MSYMSWFALVVTGCYFVALFAVMAPLRRPNALRTDPMPNPLGFLLPAAAFGVFSGLRINIGDTAGVVIAYRMMSANTTPHFRIAANQIYMFMEQSLRTQFEDPYVFLMITALFAVVPTVYILYKYSAPYELAIALYVLTGYYTFSMNGIRQYMAAGILILGAKYLFSEKKSGFLKYLALVLIAWTIHSSALIMIPVYFIVRRRAWTPFTTVLLIGTVFLTLAFDAVLPSFLNVLEDSDYSIYAESGWFTSGAEQGSSVIRVFVLIVPLALAYLWRFRMSEAMGRRWDILVNLSVLNLAFYILSLYNWIFARMAIYTSIYVIIMMTHLISKGGREQFRTLYFSMIGLYVFYFYYIRYSITEYQSELF